VGGDRLEQRGPKTEGVLPKDSSLNEKQGDQTRKFAMEGNGIKVRHAYQKTEEKVFELDNQGGSN